MTKDLYGIKEVSLIHISYCAGIKEIKVAAHQCFTTARRHYPDHIHAVQKRIDGKDLEGRKIKG